MDRKIIIYIILVLLFLNGNFVLGKDAQEGVNPLAYGTLGELIDYIVGMLFNIVIILGPLSIILAGFLYLTGGTPAKIQLAKKILLWTLAIFVIILIAKLLVSVTKEDITLQESFYEKINNISYIA